MEGDSTQPFLPFPLRNFNPLPPHGGRPNPQIVFSASVIFQSTPSAWRETLFPSDFLPFREISIHSLRMEGDRRQSGKVQIVVNPFQSTPSAWRETIHTPTEPQHLFYFNPLPPHGGRPITPDYFFRRFYISIHSLRMEGDI